MTLNGLDAAATAGSPSKSSPKNLVTLEILLNLLQARGLNDTAECLQREAGLSSPVGSSARKGEPAISELVAPATEEALRLRAHAASLAQAEQRRRIGSLAQEMSKQGQQMGEIRDLVHRVRETAASVYRPTLEEQEEQIKANDMELRELEVICSERDALARNLRIELERTTSEVSELRRTLEEREDEETKARIQLTRLEEEALKLSCDLEAVPVMTQARKIQGLLNEWHDQDGHLQVMVRKLFRDIDKDGDGRLEWNNSEIRDFVRELFSRNGIMLPNWQEHVWYEMYRRADVDHSYSLELAEAVRFARSCFEAALALVLTGQAENGVDSSMMGEQWTRTHMAVPVARSAMTYSSGVIIDFLDHSQSFATVIQSNHHHRGRMIRQIETGEHLKATMKTYRECDKDGNGKLTWNNGEIRDFIAACFRQHGLNEPTEDQMFTMYSKFDKDRNNALDMRECLEMVDALFRSTFIVEGAGSGKATPKSQQTTKPRVPADYKVPARATSPSVVTTKRIMQAPSTQPVRAVSPSMLAPKTFLEEVSTAVPYRALSPTIREAASPRTLPQVGLPGQEWDAAMQSKTTLTGPSRSLSSTRYAVSNPGGVQVAGVQRMRSGGLSPGIPMPGTVIVTSQQGSPRGAVMRAVSPDGSTQNVVMTYGRTASPIAGGSLPGSMHAPGGSRQSSMQAPPGVLSPATSQAGSHVFAATTQLSRSGSNEFLVQAPILVSGNAQARSSSSATRGAQMQEVGGQKTLGSIRSGLAPVLRTGMRR